MKEQYRELITRRATYLVTEQEEIINNLIKEDLHCLDIKVYHLTLIEACDEVDFGNHSSCIVMNVKYSYNDAVVWFKERILLPEIKDLRNALIDFLKKEQEHELLKTLRKKIGDMPVNFFPYTKTPIDILVRCVVVTQLVSGTMFFNEV